MGDEKQKLEVTKKLLLRPNFHTISKTLIDVRLILRKANLVTPNKGRTQKILKQGSDHPMVLGSRFTRL